MTTEAALPAAGLAPRMARARDALSGAVPVLSVGVVLIAIWYLGAIYMNATWAYDQAARQDRTLSFSELVADTMTQERPVLAAPHQIVEEIWSTTAEKKITSKRSLVYHGWITLSATFVGFAMGALLGVTLAVAIVHSRAMDLSVMPWIIASQMVPIIALAPMIIVFYNQFNMTGLLPKATISAYLSFFPVAVGMVKGLRSPDRSQLDLMKTYNASAWQVFWKLRLPASAPFFFASIKVAIAVALVGAIIGELSQSQEGGFGARMLNGSYYGQWIVIWAALISASICAATLVGLLGAVQRVVLERMGMARS